MSWMAATFLGLLTGVMAMIYAGLVADLAVPWLHISSFEGGSGYFVAFMGLLGLIGGTAAGIIVCRLAGGAGALRGFGAAVLVVGGVITAAGAWAWMQRDVAPLVGGQRLDLALELRLPPGTGQPAGEPGYAMLTSGPRRRFSAGPWRPEEARLEDGHWIVPGRVAITTSEGERRLAVGGLVGEGQHVPIAVPARPAALDASFSAWIAPGPAAGGPPGWEVRYRIVPHLPPAPPPPPPPGEAQLRQAAFAALPADAPTAALLGFVNAAWRDAAYDQALRTARARPDFVPVLAQRIASGDPDAARDGMYLVGSLRPVPVELVDAVRARAAEVVRIAEAIDPAAEDSRERLHAEAHTLATGVIVAAYGLRTAGVNLRAELRAIAAACRPREKDSPNAIADSAERAAAQLDQPETPRR
ncbi:hypothetical protein [Roseomonas rosulenta]|uniref:hypothetical protein n=1 Tax=Roseomonas rosulenta TaxID=2748667 RepID=UPI0018DFA248|nr:hypothetical protein [Roseomonas rosulenta]